MAIEWVVKLGGSHATAERLPLWLETLAEARVVIVPGGGPFADQVRAAQARWRFDDGTAHAMAALAMAQYGLMLAGICPRLRPCREPRALAAVLKAGDSAIWLPDPERLPAALPASWELTSDSLAAWLAGYLGARGLLLVKSAELADGVADARRLAAQGLVDPVFPGLIAGAGFSTWLCGPHRYPDLRAGLRQPRGLFMSVDAG